MGLKNFASSILNGSVNDSVTSIVVDDGSVFPTEEFYCLIESEIMYCSSRTTNTLTVTRGAEGTVAASHVTATTIKHTLTSQAWDDEFQFIKTGGYASRPATAKEGQQYYATDIDLGWRHNGTNWDLIKPIYIPYASRMDFTGWTAVNHGASSWTDINGVNVATIPTVSGTNMRGYRRTLPSAPYTLNLAVSAAPTLISNYSVGVGVTDGTKLTTIQWLQASKVSASKYNSVTSFSGHYKELTVPIQPLVWFKFQDNSTNWIMSFSFDGLNYNEIHSVARNDFQTATSACIIIGSNSTTPNTTWPFTLLGYWET